MGNHKQNKNEHKLMEIAIHVRIISSQVPDILADSASYQY